MRRGEGVDVVAAGKEKKKKKKKKRKLLQRSLTVRRGEGDVVAVPALVLLNRQI